VVTVLLVDERSRRERPDAVADGTDGVRGSVNDPDAAEDGTAADGVGNREIGPAPDAARGTDGSTTTDPTNATGVQPGSSLNPGADGVVDRPGRDDLQERVDAIRSGPNGDAGIARAGEDGSSR
jgi:hypothetical protein